MWQVWHKLPESRTAGTAFPLATVENLAMCSADTGVESSGGYDLSSGVQLALE